MLAGEIVEFVSQPDESAVIRELVVLVVLLFGLEILHQVPKTINQNIFTQQ